MPKEYEAMRDSLIARGMSESAAKSEAAATYNKRHPNNPNPWLHEKNKAAPKVKSSGAPWSWKKKANVGEE